MVGLYEEYMVESNVWGVPIGAIERAYRRRRGRGRPL